MGTSPYVLAIFRIQTARGKIQIADEILGWNECTLLLVTKRKVGDEIREQVFTEDYLVNPGAD